MTASVQQLQFNSSVTKVRDQLIVRLPEEDSEKLPSRGQVAVNVSINNHEFLTVLEPDGYWCHWIRVDDNMQSKLKLSDGEIISVDMTLVATWPEPSLPQDFANGLAGAPKKVKEKWHDITPMARWEWIRWINATGSDQTRAVRIEKQSRN